MTTIRLIHGNKQLAIPLSRRNMKRNAILTMSSATYGITLNIKLYKTPKAMKISIFNNEICSIFRHARTKYYFLKMTKIQQEVGYLLTTEQK